MVGGDFTQGGLGMPPGGLSAYLRAEAGLYSQ